MNRSTGSRKDGETFVAELPNDRVIREFATPTNLSGINAFIVGSAVFEAEQRLRSSRVRNLIIPFYQSTTQRYDLTALADLVHELLIFTIAEDINVEFRPEKTQLTLDYYQPTQPISNICLFSGGTDSYSGLLLTQKKIGGVEGVFCAHADQSRIVRIVNNLQTKVFQPMGIPIVKFGVPAITARGYAQLRGFLYLLSATAVVQKVTARRIVVTECGPTMYQPRFSPLDSITMTTHPFVVRTAAKVASLLLQRQIDVITPFENLTKAEVIAVSPEKHGLKRTHSCISQRFGSHDGTCYGCIIRRLATIAADVDDVKYNKNPISDSNASAGNLYALLNYCYDVLIDFDEMQEYETGAIREYGKRDLFRRFALDNFAAIHKLHLGNKRVVAPVRDLYQNLTGKIGHRILDQRLRHLTQPRIIPDFTKTAD
jgi:7-cyano-7-deazaguanine synthase in queuosine biosynthesis